MLAHSNEERKLKLKSRKVLFQLAFLVFIVSFYDKTDHKQLRESEGLLWLYLE